MLAESQIKAWLADGVINKQQADRMLKDVRAGQEEALGVEWAHTGTGSLLVFFSAVLNGLILVLFTFLYDLEVTAHTTFLLWMICIVPMVYTLRLGSLAVLMSLLFLAWATLFVFRGIEAMSVFDRAVQLPSVYLVCGLLLFAAGGAHYRFAPLRRLARAYRIAGIQAALLSLVALSIHKVAEGPSTMVGLRDADASFQVSLTLTALAVVAAAATVFNFAVRRRSLDKGETPDITRSEGPVSLALLAVAVLHLLAPLPTVVFVGLFSVLQVALIGVLLFIGYVRKDLRVVNLGSLALLVVLGLRYADFFFTRLPISTFIIGGLVLLAFAAVALELPRRRMRSKLQRVDAEPAEVDEPAGSD